MKKFKTLCSLFVVALLVLQTASAAKKTTQTAPKENIEVLNAEDFPNEVKVKGYTHPYRWNKIEGDKVRFKEIWGYVLTDRLKDWDKSAPLTDLALFAVEVNAYGNLEKAPSRNLVKDFKGRVHLVAVCQSRSLTHFVIDARFGKRDKLVKDLIEATKDFDGLQIDYELVPALDGEDFAEFLRLLKEGLGKKMLTVCVPARTKTLSSDVYDYARLAKICDKVMIMAYDEHWSTSAPGSIASMDWCKRIGEYALSILPQDKYIMGVPFYGRSWVTSGDGTAGAWAFNGSNRRIYDNDVTTIKRKDGVPYFEIEVTSKVVQWFEDATSLVQRCRMYIDLGYTNIAFWRMGQEDTVFWDWIEVKK